MEGDEAAVEQLRRSYDVAGSEALRRKFEEQNSADEAQIEEMRALLHTWRNEGKTEAEGELISSMQPIYSRIKRRSKMLRALRDLHKNFAKQVKSGEMDRVAMEALRGMRSTAAAARKRPASALKQAGGEGAKKRRTEETSPTGAVKLERGKHLKEKPHMPQTARAGQKRWKEMLEKMRDEAKASTPNKEFAKQMAEVRLRACLRVRRVLRVCKRGAHTRVLPHLSVQAAEAQKPEGGSLALPPCHISRRGLCDEKYCSDRAFAMSLARDTAWQRHSCIVSAFLASITRACDRMRLI